MDVCISRDSGDLGEGTTPGPGPPRSFGAVSHMWWVTREHQTRAWGHRDGSDDVMRRCARLIDVRFLTVRFLLLTSTFGRSDSVWAFSQVASVNLGQETWALVHLEFFGTLRTVYFGSNHRRQPLPGRSGCTQHAMASFAATQAVPLAPSALRRAAGKPRVARAVRAMAAPKTGASRSCFFSSMRPRTGGSVRLERRAGVYGSVRISTTYAILFFLTMLMGVRFS